MATYNKFNCFVEDVAEKKHNLGSDTLTVALTNTEPSSANTVIGDITEISYTNLSARNLTTTSSFQLAGTYRLVVDDISLYASGTVAEFRYVVIYNSTASAKNLICWFDFGAAVNLTEGDSLFLNFDQTNGLLQLV